MAFPAPGHSHNYVSKPFGGIDILIISYETHSEAGMSKFIGYARVSTRQQSTDRQRADLLAAGV